MNSQAIDIRKQVKRFDENKTKNVKLLVYLQFKELERGEPLQVNVDSNEEVLRRGVGGVSHHLQEDQVFKTEPSTLDMTRIYMSIF